MKKNVPLFLVTILWMIFPKNVFSQITPSVMEGVAPLLVHFEATYSASEFHHSLFRWNFGDDNCAHWGTDLKSENVAEGAITAHLFETPGLYQIILQKTNENGSSFYDTTAISVFDPDLLFAGNLTICVNPANDPDFSPAPTGSLHINTDSLNTITAYAIPGHRILLKRGGVWNITSTLNWPQNGGIVIIGAYGTGVNPDSMGIFENNPLVFVTGGHFLPLDFKQNWRIMDISLFDPSKQNGSFGGAESFNKWLFLRLKVDGFDVPIGWSTWNDPLGDTHVDLMGIVSCIFENCAVNVGYVGSERLMILGSVFRNASESHVLRIWQCYKGIVAHNQISGSSIDSNTGRHALKFHGPSESQIATTEWSHLNKRTQFSIIADNVFGSSGPWPVTVAPQDDWSDERLSHIIFERNQYFSDFGIPSSQSLQPADIFSFNGNNITIRNNIIDASSTGSYFTGIWIRKNTIAPVPTQVEIYNNTIYKYADPNGQIWNGIAIRDTIGTVIARNNLVMFPYVCAGHFAVYNLSPNTEYTNNCLNSTITFLDPDNTNPLERSFELHSNSISAINMGFTVPSVHNDFAGTFRPVGDAYDIGAYEYIPPINIQKYQNDPTTILYPNPTTGIVTIQSDKIIEKIEIYDVSSKKLAQYFEYPQLNLSFLSSGVYFLKLISIDHKFVIKKLFIVE
jgi:hypothetical protein